MKLASLVSALLIVVLVQSASAQWNPDPTKGTPVVTGYPSQNLTGLVASDSGHVIILWKSMDTPYGPDTTFYRMQRLDEYGIRQLPDTGVPILSYEFATPRIKSGLNGGILVLYQSDSSLHIRAVDRDGRFLWEKQAFTHQYAQSYSMDWLLGDATDGYYIVPHLISPVPTMYGEMHIQRIRKDGNLMWGPQGIHVAEAEYVYADSDEEGFLYCCYQDSFYNRLFVFKADTSGTFIWHLRNHPILLTDLSNVTSIKADEHGGAYMLVQHPDISTWGPDHELSLFRVNMNGEYVPTDSGARIPLGTTSLAHPLYSMGIFPDGSVVVVWKNKGDSVMTQRFDTTCTPMWNGGLPVLIDTGLAPNGFLPNGPDALWLFSNAFDGQYYDVVAHKINMDGTVGWGGKKYIAKARGDQLLNYWRAPVIPYGNSGAVVAWNDGRDSETDFDIYCTRIDGDGNNLPVELLSFSASLMESNVLLTWRTASETNNAGFRVQRSLDGSSWENIGYVSGMGTSTQPGEYSYLDSIGSIYADGAYYRLRQEDYDGTHEYSSLQYVAFNHQPTSIALHGVYPNPASGQIQIGFTLDADYPVTLGIYNMLGAKVRDVPAGMMPTGSHLIPADVSGLPEGMYIVRMATPAGVRSVKMRVGR